VKALGIDFGASFVDAVLFDGKKIIAKRSVARQEYSPHFLDEFPAFDTVCTTGSKPHQQMKYYGELESIGDGGLFLTGWENAVIASCGTGTAIVWKNQLQKVVHLGGTGLGGGTLMGLGKLLLGSENVDQILRLAGKGQSKAVDLTVGDILGKGIGILSENATAANFGKLTNTAYRAEDLARGLVGMIAETIGVVSCLATRGIGGGKLVFCGRLSTSVLVQEDLRQVCRVYDLKPHFLAEASYVTALGAALSCYLPK